MSGADPGTRNYPQLSAVCAGVTLGTAMAMGVPVALGGGTGSFSADTPPGALIVVLAIGVFALSWPVWNAIARQRERATTMSPDNRHLDPREPTPMSQNATIHEG